MHSAANSGLATSVQVEPVRLCQPFTRRQMAALTQETASLAVTLPSVAGEDAHESGREGLLAVHRWLDGTTRTSSVFTNQEVLMGSLLDFGWPHGNGTFSFDLGGTFLGGATNAQTFAAEVKHYSSLNDLGTHYRDFLAKCYVAAGVAPIRFRHFLWISWVPLTPTKWKEHRTAGKVSEAVLHPNNIQRVFGTADIAEARELLDAGRVAEVANNVWMVTMNNHEMDLVPTVEDQAEIAKHRKLAGGQA